MIFMSKLYGAYGSNLNFEQMAHRCPTARFLGVGNIVGYQLEFRGRACGVANVVPCEGGSVPVGIWMIESADEAALDRYEGYPRLYKKQDIPVAFGGRTTPVMFYVMAAEFPVRLPSEEYFNTILTGYGDCGIDSEGLFEAAFRSAE